MLNVVAFVLSEDRGMILTRHNRLPSQRIEEKAG